MAGEVIITPGYTFTDDNEPVTVAKLNQLGTPTARVAPGSITADEIDAASVADALENVAATRNHFRDPLFTNPWQTPAGQAHGASATRFNHPEWYAYTATGTITVSRDTITPTGEHGNRFAHKLTGDAAATGISYAGQLIPAAVAGALDESVTISVWVRNGTGDDFTPSIRLLGCSTIDDFATLAELSSNSLTEITNGQWKLLTHTFDTSALTNWRNGGAIELVFPAGTLDAGGKAVHFAMPQMERGIVASTFIVPETFSRNRVVATTTDPTADQDWTEGYRPGDVWRNSGDSGTFLCIAAQPAGAAVWVEILNPATVTPPPAYIHLQDRKTQNTAGGTATSGSWFTRELQTELVDTGSHCTLASNEFTLAAGTYVIEATVPAYKVNQFQARLYNVTDAAVQTDGTNEIYSSTANVQNTSTNMTAAILRGRFTLSASKALRIEMRVNTTVATNGLGLQANLGPEIYTEVWLVKVA